MEVLRSGHLLRVYTYNEVFSSSWSLRESWTGLVERSDTSEKS